MTTTQTNATITLTPRLTAAAEYLLLHSALASCAEIAGDQLVTVRPVTLLSSGERVLWQALGILAARELIDEDFGTDRYLGAILTDHPDLDVPNRAALATAVGIWEAAS